MTIHRRRTRSLSRSRSNDKCGQRQRDLDAIKQRHKRRGTDPQENSRAADRRRETCPRCKDVKCYKSAYLTRPLCRSCWAALGYPEPAEAERLAEGFREKERERLRKLADDSPWGSLTTESENE